MKTKFVRYLLTACLFTFLACNNDVAEIDDPAMAPSITQVPTTFDQKILLETYTSSNCGVCPENDLLRDSLASENPGRVYPVAIHLNDLLVDLSSTGMSGFNYMDSLFNPGGLSPAGAVNRKISGTSDLSPSNWRSNINSSLGTIPRCGLAIDATNITGNTLKVVVHTGFSATLSGEYRIHAYLIRSVFRSPDTAYAQLNDFSIDGPTPDSNSVFYLQAPFLINYAYKNVLVKVINDNGPEGDIIPAGSTYRGNDYSKTFTVDLTGINTAGLQIVAFVDKYGSNGTSHRVENVQLVAVGDVKNWN
ncbi:MAG: Omp28-related outer membrane protein [Bacteroidetes bacterium]|nr:MAG: Omp28-related outer membrane protein [Bacteroidota bacterium]